MLTLLLTLSALVYSGSAQLPCSPGTTKGVGCSSFQRCNQGGTGWIQVDCNWPQQAVDFNADGLGNAACVPIAAATPPCDVDCTNYGPFEEDLCFRDNLENGNYPVFDMDNPFLRHCGFFMTCLNQQCLGFQPCDEGLVFDITESICNFIFLTPPPCGTLG